jgi:hypothetical protein
MGRSKQSNRHYVLTQGLSNQQTQTVSGVHIPIAQYPNRSTFSICCKTLHASADHGRAAAVRHP